MNCNSNFLEILTNCYPDAYADICGGNDYPHICGRAYFYQFSVCGTLVKVEVGNLPLPSDSYFSAFYGMHIHENGNCTPPFDKTGDHFNPGSMPHPMHEEICLLSLEIRVTPSPFSTLNCLLWTKFSVVPS
ncbi:MAG: superoxide dismutase family protein [Eubacterium sp.]